MLADMSDVTQILSQIQAGDAVAAERLLPLVYDELRKLAAAKMAHENPGHTLQATALVHEAYLRLVDAKNPQQWDSRGHFFAAAAEAMRRILVEIARHKQSHKAGSGMNRVELDDAAMTAYLEGKEPKSARQEFFYFNDDGSLVAVRYQNWKMVFCEQRAPGTLRIWAEPFTCLRLPKLFNLRMDPYERADITSNTYYDWAIDRAFIVVPTQTFVGRFLATFKEFPPRQKAASFSIDQVVEALQQGGGGS